MRPSFRVSAAEAAFSRQSAISASLEARRLLRPGGWSRFGGAESRLLARLIAGVHDLEYYLAPLVDDNDAIITFEDGKRVPEANVTPFLKP